jgi:hypothetical protein
MVLCWVVLCLLLCRLSSPVGQSCLTRLLPRFAVLCQPDMLTCCVVLCLCRLSSPVGRSCLTRLLLRCAMLCQPDMLTCCVVLCLCRLSSPVGQSCLTRLLLRCAMLCQPDMLTCCVVLCLCRLSSPVGQSCLTRLLLRCAMLCQPDMLCRPVLVQAVIPCGPVLPDTPAVVLLPGRTTFGILPGELATRLCARGFVWWTANGGTGEGSADWDRGDQDAAVQ